MADKNNVIVVETRRGNFAIVARADGAGEWHQVEVTRGDACASMYATHLNGSDYDRVTQIDEVANEGIDFGDDDVSEDEIAAVLVPQG